MYARIGENQSAAIKNRTILHKFSTVPDVIHVSNKLNCNLALISNLKLKQNSLPSDFFYPYMGSSPGVSTLILLYITVTEILDIFIDVDTEIKRVLIGDHKIKQQILAMATSLFLKDITCHTRIQVVLKL